MDSVEGIMYSAEQAVIMNGRFVEEEEVIHSQVNRIGRYYKTWFYKVQRNTYSLLLDLNCWVSARRAMPRARRFGRVHPHHRLLPPAEQIALLGAGVRCALREPPSLQVDNKPLFKCNSCYIFFS